MTELDKIEKKMPFKVPENYFDKLQDRLDARIAASSEPLVLPEKPGRGEAIWLKLRPILYVAAMVAVIYGVTFVATLPMQSAGEVDAPATAAGIYSSGSETFEEELEYYYLDDMDVYDMYDILTLN